MFKNLCVPSSGVMPTIPVIAASGYMFVKTKEEWLEEYFKTKLNLMLANTVYMDWLDC